MNVKLPQFSRNVFFLSVVSFLNDICGEPIKKLIPLYISSISGAPPVFIGLLEGMTESLPQLFQPVSGYLSDAFKKRKKFIVTGQVLRTTVLLLSVVTTWPQMLVIRFLDRSGKGIANAPRDALVAESSPKRSIGRSFGLTRAFDNAGAVFGFLLSASVLFFLGAYTDISAGLFRYFIVASVIPLAIALFIVIFHIKDSKVIQRTHVVSEKLPQKFWLVLSVVLLFTLGNSSDAFLILKAKEQGVVLPYLFLFLALYSGISSITGYIFSSWSDRIGRKKVVLAGWVSFIIVYFLFPHTTSLESITVLFMLYGLYLGLTEGVIKAWISDIVPAHKKATAFGLFYMSTGLMLLPASLLAGLLWQFFGLSTALYIDGFIAVSAVILLLFV
jgi:MFS family permease